MFAQLLFSFSAFLAIGLGLGVDLDLDLGVIEKVVSHINSKTAVNLLMHLAGRKDIKTPITVVLDRIAFFSRYEGFAV